MPAPKQVRFVAAAMLAVALLFVALNFAKQHGGITPFGPELGADYPAFFIAGQVLNSTPERLHDLALQEKLYHQLIPDAPAGQFLFYPSAPFLAIIFRPLALLPYAWSYLAWLAIGAVVAMAAYWLMWKASPGLAGGDWLTVMLAAFSFTPFLLEGWIGGQPSALTVFCAALAIYLRQRGHKFSAGMALATLAFKPTLMLLLVPMLLITRSFRVLSGVIAGGLGLLALSVWAVGCEGCMRFLRYLVVYAQVERANPEALRSWKYVDLRSAAYPIFHHPSLWSSVVLAVLIIAGATLLWRTWRHSTDWRLAWATALIWTPVLSPHCAIYDTALLIPAVILVAPTQKTSDWFLPLVALVYVTAWCSQPIAAVAGFQPLSATIILLGLYLCRCQAAALVPTGATSLSVEARI
jgi:hypothetical protein